MNSEIIVGIHEPIEQTPPETLPIVRNQGPVAELIKFEDRTDLSHEERERILAERAEQA